jgi:Zn ribbon nucleic-acid-binding protein
MIDINELHKRLDYYVNGPEDDCDRQAGEAPSPEDVLEMTSEIIRLRSAASNRNRAGDHGNCPWCKSADALAIEWYDDQTCCVHCAKCGCYGPTVQEKWAAWSAWDRREGEE